MAQAMMSYLGPADGVNRNFQFTGTITDDDAALFFEYYRSVYGNYWDATAQKVTTNPKAPDGTDNPKATDEQLWVAHAVGYSDGMEAQINRFKQQKAAQDAVSNVPPVVIDNPTRHKIVGEGSGSGSTPKTTKGK